MSLKKKCQQIALLLADVDGVLTDGRVVMDNQGVETKHFHIRDGLGIRVWQQSGGKTGIVTGRSSQVVKLRVAELGIEIVRQGVADKLPVVEAICEELGLQLQQVCYVGDDLPDVPVIRAVGLGIAVSDAAEEVCAAADYTTRLCGGQGAIREVIELVLKNTGRWEQLIGKYTG